MRPFSRVACAGVAAAVLACAAGAGDRPAFEVASIKPAELDTAKIQSQSAAGIQPKMGKQISGTRVEYRYMSLAELIADAYHVNFNRIGGPDWIRSVRYDIVARMPEGGAEDGARLMLQSLLEQRFRLAIRRETSDQPVLALVIGKGGSKLKEAAGAADQKPSYQYDSSGTILRLIGPALTMPELAEMLSAFSKLGGADGRFIVDRTGLHGKYQVALDIPLAHLRQMAQATRNDLPPDAGEASDPAGPSLFESVQALGLRLERQKAPVEQLIVERAEKAPTAN